MAVAVAPKWKTRRQRVFQSVFQTDITQPTPFSTPSLGFSQPSQPFGEHLDPPRFDDNHPSYPHTGSSSQSRTTLDHGRTRRRRGQTDTGPPIKDAATLSSNHAPTTSGFSFSSQPLQAAPLFPDQSAAEQQIRFDRAWHVVTSRIALPPSATADDSFGTLPPDSQGNQSQGLRGTSEAEFYEALSLILNAQALLPRATHIDDIVDWHTQQVRRHFTQHVRPLLSACVSGQHGAESVGSREEEIEGAGAGRGSSHEEHMIFVMSSVRTLEAALRLYSHGLQLILRGLQRFRDTGAVDAYPTDPDLVAARFRRDVQALVSNSASPAFMISLRSVLVHLIGSVLGVPSRESRPAGLASASASASASVPATGRSAPPAEDDPSSLAARKRLMELLEPLHDVGLTGEKFQLLFGEIMDEMMSDFVRGAYAGVWTASGPQPARFREMMGTPITGLPNANMRAASPCVASLCDWVENHYARLAIQVLSRVAAPPDSSSSDQPPIALADVKTYQSLALGRLAALRISELFDIILAWPSSRAALDDLRIAVSSPQRRMQLTDSFSATLQTRLLHPGRSTLEILQTYISIIRAFHALDHSKVLLTRVSPSLQIYLCGREDAVRIVVTGLLASPDEVRAAKMENAARGRRGTKEARRWTSIDVEGGASIMTPIAAPRSSASKRGVPRGESIGWLGMRQDASRNASSADVLTHNNKLVGLAALMADPAQSRGAHLGPDEDADLDWNDMTWVPDPVDAGANYKRPRSEDVIGTLISSLGSQDTFIREFQIIVAERLLSDQPHFDQEVRVLHLLKKRFGESALQNCDVMIRDIHESRRLDDAIRRALGDSTGGPSHPISTPINPRRGDEYLKVEEDDAFSSFSSAVSYRARILSRLFWPNLDREYFLLPPPVAERQKRYEQGYEYLKSSRKLAWLNQLGQAAVELELRDRTLTVDCKTYEATVIYAFQDDDAAATEEDASPPGGQPRPPARRSVQDLVDRLQMDDDLIVSALDFWVSKGALRRSQNGIYAVVETLSPDDDDDGDPSAVAAEEEEQHQGGGGRGGGGGASSSAAAATVTMSEKEQSRRQMYWQYIRGMLTNASATMPLAQMAMMMKMLIADGFPWTNEELQDFLGEKVSDGELEVVGGKYRLPRK